MIVQCHKDNKLVGNLIELTVRKCSGMEYLAWDEVSNQNPTSNLPEHSASQPVPLSFPFCFATEKYISLEYYTEECFKIIPSREI